MKLLILESWLLLLSFEPAICSHNFKKLHQRIRKQLSGRADYPRAHSPERLCRAVDIACAFYFKKVLCLQRSAATTLLLRRYGWNAEMVIGAQILPFRSHAWVEINGLIVNDKPYMADIYRVLERC